MAAKRGRTITTFGQMFMPMGLSGSAPLFAALILTSELLTRLTLRAEHTTILELSEELLTRIVVESN